MLKDQTNLLALIATVSKVETYQDSVVHLQMQENTIKNFKEIALHFWKYVYELSCQEFVEKIDTSLMSVL